MAPSRFERFKKGLRRLPRARSPVDKGRALEDLLEHLLCGIPGVTLYDKDVHNTAHSQELDLVFWNTKLDTGLNFLPEVLLVECKNWLIPVGAAEIEVFVAKLRSRACTHGVLFAANGITGNPNGPTAGHNSLQLALASGIRVLVLTLDEVSILPNARGLVEVLKTKLCQLTARGTSLPVPTAVAPAPPQSRRSRRPAPKKARKKTKRRP